MCKQINLTAKSRLRKKKSHKRSRNIKSKKKFHSVADHQSHTIKFVVCTVQLVHMCKTVYKYSTRLNKERW